MERDKYEKIALPQIKSIAKKFDIEFSEKEYEQVINDALQMTNTATSMYKQDITKNPVTHREILRASIINVYKRKHKASYLSMFMNVGGGALLLYSYISLVAQWCPFGSFNYLIAMMTCAIILYRLCKNHNSFMDKIIPRKMKIARWKRMSI